MKTFKVGWATSSPFLVGFNEGKTFCSSLAIAERVNGILKTEVIYREKRFKTYQDALERISGFIAFYNDTRPHSSIGMKTPSEAHQEQGPQRIMWKPAGGLSGAVCPLPLGTP